MKLAILIAISMLPAAFAEDGWTLRGAAAGVAEDKNLPDTWSATQNVVWKVDIPPRLVVAGSGRRPHLSDLRDRHRARGGA
jgi:hypothetical protein